MRFTKEEFCTAVDKLENMYRQGDEILKALGTSEWVLDEWINNYYELIRDMCDIEDSAYVDDLSYYCWELDFGKNWHEGMITIDDKDMPCRNVEELWELINYKND